MLWSCAPPRDSNWGCGSCSYDCDSGLGIGTTPSALMAHGINTTIVEIDPVVYDFALRYFALPRNHVSVIEDAITYVKGAQRPGHLQERYDYIIHDVFTGGAEPAALFTTDFLTGLSHLLKPGGVIAVVSCPLRRGTIPSQGTEPRPELRRRSFASLGQACDPHNQLCFSHMPHLPRGCATLSIDL